MFKLVQKKFGKKKTLGTYESKIDAIFAHINYTRKDRVFLIESK